jgi:hypothetical protein
MLEQIRIKNPFYWWWHYFYLLNYRNIKIIFTRITLSSFTKSCIALQPILDLKTEDFNGLNIFTEKLHLSNQLQRWKLEARSKSPNLLLPAFYPVIHLRIHPHMGIIHTLKNKKNLKSLVRTLYSPPSRLKLLT